jgi:type II secretory pathway pseudopilin PulG
MTKNMIRRRRSPVMIPTIPHIRKDRGKRETGDTLVEVLIAIVIIGIGAVALIGALTTSITSSATYRSLSTIDTVLKSFAEGVKYDVQLQPAPTALYSNCAKSYEVATVYPTRDVVGAGVTVFATDVTPGAVSVFVGPAGSQVPSQNFLSGDTVENGNVAVTFTLPPTPAGTWPVRLDTGSSVTTATPLTVIPSISTVSPTAGVVGSTVTVSATGFLASAPLNITLDGVPATITSGGTTGTDGSATATFTVPSVPSGPQTLVASDGTYTATAAFAVADPTYTVPPLTAPPASAVAGYKLSITSIGWWNSSTLQFDSST